MMDSYNEKSPLGSQSSRFANTLMKRNLRLRCKHKWKAVIRVSSSKTYLGRLYYSCPKEKVNFTLISVFERTLIILIVIPGKPQID